MRKNQKLCKVRPKRHLPSDLYPDILSRLPVKSLLRFRCVAKSWLALVDDEAEFARLHLRNFKNNSDITHLLVVHNTRLNCVVRRSDTFEAIPGALGTLPLLGHSALEMTISFEREWVIVCFVDGLILLKRSRISSSSDLQVWNPSIRKFLQLPSFPENLGSSLHYSELGLGYDTLSKHYKLVLLAFADTAAVISGTPIVLIYTFGANSWKTVEFRVKGGSEFSIHPFTTYYTWPRLYFQGCLYMICSGNKLGIFDISSEVFSTIDIPEFHYVSRLVSVDGGCSLAMLGYDQGKRSIWVLQTESMSWTRRYTFKLKCSQFWHLKNNCDILVLRRHYDKTIKRGWDQPVVYIPENDEYKDLHEKRSSSSYYKVKAVHDYVESLILHK